MWQTILVWLLLFVQLIQLAFFTLILYVLARGLFGVPWVRTHRSFVKKMFEFAELKQGQRVVDYGCGDGAMLVEAARTFGATGVGYEYLRALVIYARLRARVHRVADKVSFRRKDFLKETVLPGADLISIYLFPEVNAKLEPLLKRDYPSGTRVVSRTFPFPTLPLVKETVIEKEHVYLYQIP